MTIELSKCRICAGTKFEDLFDLGEQPLANALLYPPLPGQLNISEPKYPLVLVKCKACGHTQLKHTVTPEEMFSQYCFHTASSPRMVEHFSQILLYNAPYNGMMVEIGSNDGSVLQAAKKKIVFNTGIKFLGIDPSKNLCEEARNRGVDVHCDFFGKKCAEEVVKEHGQAQFILCANVLGHVPDLNDFVEGLKVLLAPHGRIIIEVPHVLELYNNLAFDTIYHEHASYFSIKNLVEILNIHGLFVECIDKQLVHGGTIRCYVRTSGANATSVVLDIFNENIESLDWTVFEKKVNKLRYDLQQFLEGVQEHDLCIVGYGAAAKAAVLLNYCQVDTGLLQYVADCTKDKQGKLMPGTHQKILSPEEMYQKAQTCPLDYVLVLPWNHAQEIVNKEASKYPGTKWITPNLEEIVPTK